MYLIFFLLFPCFGQYLKESKSLPTVVQYYHLADNVIVEAVALALSKEVDVKVLSLDLELVSINTGIVAFVCPNKPLPLSIRTTYDIVGLIAGDAWVPRKPISMMISISFGSYSLGSNVLSTNFKCMPFSYSFHACQVRSKFLRA